MKPIKDLHAASLEPLPVGVEKEYELAAIQDLYDDAHSQYPLQSHLKDSQSRNVEVLLFTVILALILLLTIELIML